MEGKAEGQLLGKALLRLSAHEGCWHDVPWRMLHNHCMGRSALENITGLFEVDVQILACFQ